MSTFQPGDRVTSPLLVGEWEVESVSRETRQLRLWRRFDNLDCRLVSLDAEHVTHVTPPLPPEPPAGSVVFVGSDAYVRRFEHRYDEECWQNVLTGSWYPWSSLADLAVPAVPKPSVEQMGQALRNIKDRADLVYHPGEAASRVIARLWPEEEDQ